jgi:hypothetical protein
MRYTVIAPGAAGGRLVTVSSAAGGLAVTEEAAPEAVLAAARAAGFAGGAILFDTSADSLIGGSADDPVAQLVYAGPDPQTLHAHYASRGLVDDRAPTRAGGKIAIQAPPGRVWAVLAEVEGWPAIRADIADVRAEGPAAPGVRFTWRGGANRFASRWGIVSPGRQLTWTSVAPGTRVVHVYDFARDGDSGGTLLSCRETLAAPVLARLVSSAFLQAGVDSWLAGVKAVAES